MSLMTMRDYIAVHSEISVDRYEDTVLEKIVGRPVPTNRLGEGKIEYLAWVMEAEAKLCYMRADAFMKAKR